MVLKMLTSPLLKQYAVVIIANLNVLTTGLGLSWTSPVLVKLSNETTSPLASPITEEEGSWILSVSGISGIFGAFAVGFLADFLGRKYTILASALPKLAGWLLICLASDVRMIYAAKVLHGFSDSVSMTVVAMYASEVASKEVRGALGTVLQIMCTLGVVLTICVGPFLEYLTLGILCGVASLICASTVVLLPESPYYSYSKGKKDEAFKTLTTLRGSTIQAAEGMKEFELEETKQRTKITELLTSKPVVRGLFISVIIGFGSQMTGFNAVSFSLQSVLESTKTGISAAWSSVIVGAVQLLACFPSALMSDRFGRKPILCSMLVAMCIGLTSLGIFFKLVDQGFVVKGFLQFLPLVSILVVVAAFSAGLGSLLFPLMAELFSDEARSLGVSLGVTGITISSFITLRCFAPLISWLGPASTYWLFGMNSLFLCIFIMFCVPETKGKTFAEIQVALGLK